MCEYNSIGENVELKTRIASDCDRKMLKGRHLRYLRGWPLLLLVISLFFALGHFAGATQKEDEILRAKSILSERFEVRGGNGKTLASLSRGQKGDVLLSFFDKSAFPRLLVGLDADGVPIVSFIGEGHKPRMILSLAKSDWAPQISLSDQHGEPTISLGSGDDLGTSLMVGKRGQGQISVAVSKDGVPAINVLDKKNNPQIMLSVLDGGPVILLFDSERNVRSAWSVSADGSARLVILDKKSKERLSVMADREGKPSIRFIDPDQNTFKELKVE